MRRVASAWLACLFFAGGVAAAQADAPSLPPEMQRAEQLGWFDPEASLALLDKIQPQIHGEEAEIEALTLRGFAYVDSKQDEKTQETLERLHDLARQGSSAADFSHHVVQAYFLRESDRYEVASAELEAIDPRSLHSDLDHYRFEHLRGCVLRFLGKHEAAMLSFERALDLAYAMKKVPYVIHTLLTSSQFLLRIGNFDRASAQLAQAKQLAQQIGDEASLVPILQHESDISSRHGDFSAGLRAMLEALVHAKKLGSPQLLALTYANLGDAYLKMRDFATSLMYSKQALALGSRIRHNGFEQTVRFNIAIAQIGLGHVGQGKRLVEREIQSTLDASNIVDAEDSVREYADALVAAHDWHAVEVLQRDAQMRDQLMTTVRQQALTELSAKFDAERRARQIDLLTRDNAIKSAALNADRLRQQLVLAVALLAMSLCVSLGWAFRGARKANKRLRYNSEHDPLTGLPNRRYFHEHVLSERGASQFEGCVLILDIDHFKRINDQHGHLTGDHVLACTGKRLAAALRAGDTLVRWGGEEFLAVLPPMPETQLEATARRLLNTVTQEPIHWQEHTIHCTVSIGYASFPLPGISLGVSLDRAISLADKALYQAKRRGRNRACRVSGLHAQSEAELSSINTDLGAVAERVQFSELAA
ncbi:MAG: diguanylate cyclase domain-containing protein [Steroidobacteraceae bacterium]